MNIIDGGLRIVLILRKQLQQKTDLIELSLIKQADQDKLISELAVYKRCLEGNVIDDDLFNILSAAYEKRRKCIHDHLLSDINYDCVTSLVFEFDLILDRVVRVVFDLEKEQINKEVDMTVDGYPVAKEFLHKYASQKEKGYNLELKRQ